MVSSVTFDVDRSNPKRVHQSEHIWGYAFSWSLSRFGFPKELLGYSIPMRPLFWMACSRNGIARSNIFMVRFLALRRFASFRCWRGEWYVHVSDIQISAPGIDSSWPTAAWSTSAARSKFNTVLDRRMHRTPHCSAFWPILESSLHAYSNRLSLPGSVNTRLAWPRSWSDSWKSWSISVLIFPIMPASSVGGIPVLNGRWSRATCTFKTSSPTSGILSASAGASIAGAGGAAIGVAGSGPKAFGVLCPEAILSALIKPLKRALQKAASVYLQLLRKHHNLLYHHIWKVYPALKVHSFVEVVLYRFQRRKRHVDIWNWFQFSVTEFDQCCLWSCVQWHDGWTLGHECFFTRNAHGYLITWRQLLQGRVVYRYAPL